MADRTIALAEFLVENQGGDLLPALAQHFPDVTEEEFDRGFAIAEEIIKARLAEREAEVKALRTAMDGRPRR